MSEEEEASGMHCPRCAEKYGTAKKHSIQQYQSIASARGGQLLDTRLQNCFFNYTWRCQKGHTWKMRGLAAVSGKWCRFCTSRHSKAELDLYQEIKKVYPDALSGSRGLLASPLMELDIYVPSKKKAVEFDGTYWHSLPNSPERDLRKNSYCQQAGIKLLRVPERQFSAERAKTIRQAIQWLGV